MFPAKCKAILKTIDNNILETGFASYSAQGQYIDFTSPFVPIMKIKSKIKVVCSDNGVITHVFTGEVYLSSPRLLRVVSLKCAFLTGAEKALAADINFDAQILLPAFHHTLFINKLIYKWQNCTIKAISTRGVALECDEILDQFAEKVTVKISEPVFSKPTELNLHTGEKGLMFGNHTKYKYKIGKLSKRAEAELCNFIRQANIRLLGTIEIIDENTLY